MTHPRISISHPTSFIRDRPDDCQTTAVVHALQRSQTKIRVAGVVTHRQRPATAKGVYFLNLEDETGMLNVVVLPDTWAKHRNTVRRSPALIIQGRLEHDDGVTNLIAHNFEPLNIQTIQSRDFR